MAPAVSVGLAVALVGLAPRAATAVWAGLAGCLVVSILGELLSVPDWVRTLSPFEHVPNSRPPPSPSDPCWCSSPLRPRSRLLGSRGSGAATSDDHGRGSTGARCPPWTSQSCPR